MYSLSGMVQEECESSPQPELLWSNACLHGAFSRAREQCVLKNKHLLDRVTFDFNNKSSETKETEDYSVFSVDNLHSLVVSYDALWPVSAFYSPCELRLLSTVTRLLLEIGHCAVLVRMVQCDLRSLKVEAERNGAMRSNCLPLRGDAKKRMMLSASYRAPVQAASSFGSNRLRILQGKLREEIALKSRGGCASMFAVIQAYNRSVVSSLFITSNEAGTDDPASCIVGLLLQELLGTARSTLEALSILVEEGQCGGLRQSLERLDSALEVHRNIKEALVEAAEQLVTASDNEHANILLLYLL